MNAMGHLYTTLLLVKLLISINSASSARACSSAWCCRLPAAAPRVTRVLSYPTLTPEPTVLRSASLAGQLRGRAGRPEAVPVPLTALPRLDGLNRRCSAFKSCHTCISNREQFQETVRNSAFTFQALYSVVASVACILTYSLSIHPASGFCNAGDHITYGRCQSSTGTTSAPAIVRLSTGSRCTLEGSVQQLVEVPHRPLNGGSIPAAQSNDQLTWLHKARKVVYGLHSSSKLIGSV